MMKPATRDGYEDEYTADCERVLVTLLRGLGPWRDSIYLVYGKKLSWRWQTRTERGAVMALELLADAPHIAGGKVQPLPTDGTISALNIPHSSIVFDLHQVAQIRAELLGGNGVVTENIRHTNLVGPVSAAKFELGESDEPGQREARILRQRQVSDLIDQLLSRVE